MEKPDTWEGILDRAGEWTLVLGVQQQAWADLAIPGLE